MQVNAGTVTITNAQLQLKVHLARGLEDGLARARGHDLAPRAPNVSAGGLHARGTAVVPNRHMPVIGKQGLRHRPPAPETAAR